MCSPSCEGPPREAYESALERWLTASRFSAGRREPGGADEKLSGVACALRVHAAMISQIPQTPSDQRLVVVGYANTISEIIDGAARDAADELVAGRAAPVAG